MTVATHDALFGGRVALRQPARGAGYRTNVDALLLAAFAGAGRRAARAVDLGSGVGAIGLSLLFWDRVERVALVEIDAAAIDAARANLEANGWADRGDVVRADIRELRTLRLATADLVVSNPPYIAPGTGRLPRAAATARARSGELADFTSAARAVLGRRGRACFVYPANALTALVTALAASGLAPKRLRAVHADATSPARVVMIEAVAGKPGGLEISAPLFERDAGHYTREMAQLLEGVLIDPPRAAGRG